MTTLTRRNSKYNTKRLVLASGNGDFEQVKYLISFSDPKTKDSEALRIAAHNGHIECVKLLIPVSDPTAQNSEALRMAVWNGRTDIAELLLPVSDPKAYDNLALQWAVRREYVQMIKLLIPVSDCNNVIKQMRAHNNIGILQQCIEEHEALKQKERLEICLQEQTINAQNFKRKI